MERSTSHVVAVLDELRGVLKLNHRQFAEEFLGRGSSGESEWSMYRTGARAFPSDGFVRAAVGKVAEVGPPWQRLLEDAIQQDALARVA